jgi:hypothetical protein
MRIGDKMASKKKNKGVITAKSVRTADVIAKRKKTKPTL